MTHTIEVGYRSIWEEGEITTKATLDLETGEVRDIETSEEGAKWKHHSYDEIIVAEKGYMVVDDDGVFPYSICMHHIPNILKDLNMGKVYEVGYSYTEHGKMHILAVNKEGARLTLENKMDIYGMPDGKTTEREYEAYIA